MEEHIKALKRLSKLAKTSPHSAYFIHQTCTQHELTFLQRIENSEKYLGKVESKRIRLVEVLFDKTIVNQNKWKEYLSCYSFNALGHFTKNCRQSVNSNVYKVQMGPSMDVSAVKKEEVVLE